MIFDNIKNIKNYKGINKNLDDAIDFVLNSDLEKLELTSKAIINDKVYYFLNEYICKNEDEIMYEIHKNHFDIQLIIEGEELMKCFSNDAELEPYSEYDPIKDYQFYKRKDGGATFIAKKYDFAIFMPGEYHLPSIKRNDNNLRKIVLKIEK